jgi:rhodanese-related sulfurtransferase
MTARIRPILATGALALGIAAAIVGTPNHPVRASVDVRALASEVARESDHITALQLAEWIKGGKPGLQVLDVRTVQEFDRYHIPTARSVPLDTLVTTKFDTSATLVLYSEGGGHAAQAWVLLRAMGYPHVFSLRGGVEDWLQDVMHPAVPTDVTRYFGGFTRKPGDAPLTVEALRRHGC